jgi:hypothetical protein
MDPMGFQAPFEIAQTQLQELRISSVDFREALGSIHPFFDDDGTTRFLVIATVAGERTVPAAGLWVVEEFPLEIRTGKAIYPRPIVNYRPLAEVDPSSFTGRYHFDAGRTLAAHPSIDGTVAGALDRSNIALRIRGRETVRDLFFTLDLRRLTGAASRSGVLLRRRLEIAGLRTFLCDTEPAGR